MRCVGTVVRGIRTPVIKDDTNLVDVVIDSLLNAKESEGFTFRDRDMIRLKTNPILMMKEIMLLLVRLLWM